MTRQRVITSPVRLTGSVHPEQLSALVSIDALQRRRAALGQEEVIWELSTLAGDAAVQRAVQRVVAREGDDKDELGRDGFAARARRLEQEAEVDLRELLSRLNVAPDMDRWGTESEDALRAARVAFVRLYESGALTRNDTVVDSCPSCESVVDEVDTDLADVDVEHIRVSIPLLDATLEVDLAEPELLVGAVAVAVPPHAGIKDVSVFLPLVDAEVPVVVVDGIDAPKVVVPGHDLWSYELARQLDWAVVEVLDGEGVVRRPGPLEGLGRYAARTAATEQLVSGGYVVASFSESRSIKRCYRCATPLVPLFGRHWLLSFRSLVDAAVERIRGGAVAFSPVNAMDHLLSLAERSGDWVVSQQLWSGQRIPVASCLDCGQTEVSVDFAESCKSCMGTLEPHTDVLDARFIAAVTPLAMLGWPSSLEPVEETSTTFLIGRSGLDVWALPIAALGLRLGDRIPFQQLIVHQAPIGVTEPGQQVTNEMIDWVDTAGRGVVRVSFLLGDMDSKRAEEIVRLLQSPATGPTPLAGIVERVDKALLGTEANEALAILTNAARDGISADSQAEWQALLEPLLAPDPLDLCGG